MEADEATLAPLIKKLRMWGPLGEVEEHAILSLPHKVELVQPHRYLARDGELTKHCCLLVDGFAFRQKILVDGARSINAIHLRGDIVDLQNSLLGCADHSVQTLTSSKVAFIAREEIKRVAFELPQIAFAMWHDTLVDGSIFREWIANVSRRDARARVSHLLCEFAVKLEAIGLGDRLGCKLPMTQEQLADSTGMTSVHMNRTLGQLEAEGLIGRGKRYVAIADWNQLANVGGFTSGYLHLPAGDDLQS